MSHRAGPDQCRPGGAEPLNEGVPDHAVDEAVSPRPGLEEEAEGHGEGEPAGDLLLRRLDCSRYGVEAEPVPQGRRGREHLESSRWQWADQVADEVGHGRFRAVPPGAGCPEELGDEEGVARSLRDDPVDSRWRAAGGGSEPANVTAVERPHPCDLDPPSPAQGRRKATDRVVVGQARVACRADEQAAGSIGPRERLGQDPSRVEVELLQVVDEEDERLCRGRRPQPLAHCGGMEVAVGWPGVAVPAAVPTEARLEAGGDRDQ